MTLRSISRKSLSIKSTILTLGISLFALAPATLHASSFDYTIGLTLNGTSPTTVNGAGTLDLDIPATLAINTNYYLTLAAGDNLAFSIAGQNFSLTTADESGVYINFSSISPSDLIYALYFNETIGSGASEYRLLSTSDTYTLGYGANLTGGADYGTYGVSSLTSGVTSATPEPGSFLLLATGLLGGAGTLLRRYQLQRM